MAANLNLYGGAGNDVLTGNDGNGYFDGGAGNDILLGGTGADAYMFSAGSDVITDRGGKNDKLYLRTSVKFVDLVFERYGNDLFITDKRLGSTMTIVDHFGAGKIEWLRMGDGTLLDLSTGMGAVQVLKGTSGDDIFRFATGTAHVRDTAGNDRIETTAAFSDLSFGISGSDLSITDNRTGQILVIDKQYAGQTVETLRLGNGNTVSLAGTNFYEALNATTGDDIFRFGVGNLHIADPGGNDQIETSAAFSDLSFIVNGDELRITDARTGQRLVLDKQYAGQAVETLRLGNGNSVSLTGTSFYEILFGTAGDDIFHFGTGTVHIADPGGSDRIETEAAFSDLSFEISGTDLVITDTRTGQILVLDKHYAGQSVETLRLGNGSDVSLTGTRFSDALAGTTGDDIFHFGTGTVHIADPGGNDRIDTDAAFSDLRFEIDGENLVITDTRTGQILVLDKQYAGQAIETLRLGNGNIVSLTDTSFLNIVTGTTGDDVFQFGTGTVHIADPGGNDRIETDAAFSDLSFEVSGDNLVITDARTGQKLVLDKHYAGQAVETLHLGNGGEVSLTGTSFQEVLTGTTGDDIFQFRAVHIADPGGNDRIETDAAFSDLNFTVSGDDLIITDMRDGQILVLDKHYAGQAVETLRLGNGADVSLTGTSFIDPTSLIGFDVRARETDWGGVGANLYRGADVLTGTGAVNGNPNDAHIVTVALGTTVQQLEQMIADAQSGTTFLLEKGTYVFDDRLDINRGDITLKGAGEGETTILTTVTGTDAIRVQAAWQKDSWGNIEWVEAKLNTTLAAPAGQHDTSVRLNSVAGIDVGDYLEVSVKYYMYLDDGNDDFKGTLVEVTGVDEATGVVTLAHEVGFDTGSANAAVKAVPLLHNVVLGDFTLDYGTPQNAVDPFRYVNTNPQYVGEGGTGVGNGVRGIFLNSLADSALYNVTIHNAGSNGVFVREAVGMEINGLTVDGVQNMDGGNGYGLEIARTYFSDFDNLTFKGLVRHAVTYAKDGSSAYNNVHILSSTANVDFHGGPDYKNIYYIENMSLNQLKDDYSYAAVDYRDPNNVYENAVIFDNLVATDALTITKYYPGYVPINYTGNDSASALNNFSATSNDVVTLGSAGGYVFTGAGNDTITLGSGNDIIRTGAGNDKMIYNPGGGVDLISDFDRRYDKIAINGAIDLGIRNLSTLLAHTHMNGVDTVIDLGVGDALILAGFSSSLLLESNFIFG